MTRSKPNPLMIFSTCIRKTAGSTSDPAIVCKNQQHRAFEERRQTSKSIPPFHFDNTQVVLHDFIYPNPTRQDYLKLGSDRDIDMSRRIDECEAATSLREIGQEELGCIVLRCHFKYETRRLSRVEGTINARKLCCCTEGTNWIPRVRASLERETLIAKVE